MVGVEEEEYESDPEQAKLYLKMMRRKEASDDEEEEDDPRGRGMRTVDSRVSENDGQGAAAEDDDEESDLEEDLLEEEEKFGQHCGSNDALEVHEPGKDSDDGDGVIVKGSLGEKEDEQTDVREVYVQDNAHQIGDNVNGSEEQQGQEAKKENEPFAVPTAGAFYMHDDRFRDSVGGRHRQTLGERKLWELRDDRKWGHDKFEEMTMHERPYDEGKRVSRGRNGARGRNKGEYREYSLGMKPRAQDNNNQNSAPKFVRGKGPRRYQPTTNNNIEYPASNKRHSKSLEKAPYSSLGRASAAISTSEASQIPSRKISFASSLSSASPPFYPSVSSNKAINSTQKRVVQTGLVDRNKHPLVSGETYLNAQSNNIQGKGTSDSLGVDKLYLDDSAPSHYSGKHLKNLLPSTSGPSYTDHTKPLQARNKGIGQTSLGKMAYLPVPSHKQANRAPLQNLVHAFQRTTVQNKPEFNYHPSGQQSGSRSTSGSQASSPPKHLLESTELASHLESNNSDMAMVGKGKGSMQSNGASSFTYAGAQVMTTSGIRDNHGDQNFSGTSAFLPVMHFAGQHHGGIGVPAVGMAFPGYVAQPNGMGNSEMTWLPVLGATGTLGGTYGSPYITMDGVYHAHTSGQASSLAPASSEGCSVNEPGNKVKPTQTSAVANVELGQRQNKARRYTEMKFDQ